MGLVSWIKNSYYNYRLNQADNNVQKGKLNKAETIYLDLLGKQECAVYHLANMLSNSSKSVQEQITCLRRIVELNQHLSPSNHKDYQKELGNHLSKMETSAEALFARKDYASAVTLIDGVLTQKNNVALQDKSHRYKGYNFFKSSQNTQNYKDAIDSVISEFKAMTSVPLSDVKSIQDELVSQRKYVRAIRLLLGFSNDQNFRNTLFSHIACVALGKDCECNPVKISAICNNATIAKEAAEYLAKKAIGESVNKEYKNATIYDRFASEYLSDNNQFNYDRCVHVIEELSDRADAIEVKEAIELAKELHLSESQISSLLRQICEFASKADDTKAINICKLFKSQKIIDQLYIKKAESICNRGNCATLDTAELLGIIKSNTTPEIYPDYLGKFVVYFTSFEKEYYSSAIYQILKENSVSLLEKYWIIKPNTVFFEKLVCSSCQMYKSVVSFIISKHQLFLGVNAFRKYFCEQLSSIDDIKYILSVSEELIGKGCDINEFYTNQVVSHTKKVTEEEAIEIIDHALTVIINKSLSDEKKRIVRKLIALGNFTLAENEAKTLSSIDDEAWTVLAECYFTKADHCSEDDSVLELLYKVIDIKKAHALYPCFDMTFKSILAHLTQMALESLKNGNREKAYSICNHIPSCYNQWLSLYISLRNEEYTGQKTIGNKIKFIDETLEVITNEISDTTCIHENDYLNIWAEAERLYVDKSSSQPKDKAIESLSNFRNKIENNCCNEFSSEHIAGLTSLIVKLKWNYAQDLEIDHSFEKAAELYTSVVNENVTAFVKRAEYRSLICKLKADSVTPSVEASIKLVLDGKSFEALREDLAYRYACYLIKSIRPAEAEGIIKEYLPEENTLLNFCKNIYIKESEKYLSEFNQKLNSVRDGKMSTSDALKFFKEIDGYKAKIANNLQDTSAKFSKYKTQIRAYILNCFFNDEEYLKAFQALSKMYPNFIENDLAFRNLSVAAIGIIESDCQDEQQLRRAISLALSAIYSDKLFIASLDNTSWDDQFTFTLEDSLGRTVEDDYDTLPDNVNFETPFDGDNSIVSIKDVQNNLVIRIEKAIRELHPNLEEFCRQEKDALDKILELNMDEDFILATPNLASTVETAETSIKEALDYEYEQDYGNKEDVLAVGVMYGFTDNDYNEYRIAQQLLSVCKGTLTSSVSAVKGAFALSIVNKIKAFDRLFSDLKAACSTAMNNSIRDKQGYSQFLDFYEPICKAIKDSTLSFSCANYINGEIIQRLNDDSMKERDGIGYMVRIYNLAPSNERVKGNVEGILRNLVISCEENGNSADKTALNNAQRALNGKFDKFIEEARVQATLGVIVDKVISNSMSKNTALKKVYELYKQYPNNDRICQDLVTICDICIHQYIINDNSGKQEVRRILNELKTNKSSTFKLHANKFEESYDNIMSHVPSDSRDLLENGFSFSNPGASLNSAGLCLKEGLEYYSELGDFPMGIARVLNNLNKLKGL